MAKIQTSTTYFPAHSPDSVTSGAGYPFERKSSTSSSTSSRSISPTSPGPSPKVHLVPYAHTASFETTFSDVERELLDRASFDSRDLSSQDFDFEDIFTYDKPQKKLAKVVEVSRPTRNHRDWSNFSFSHYQAALQTRHKVNTRSRSGAAELYIKNSIDAKKH